MKNPVKAYNEALSDWTRSRRLRKIDVMILSADITIFILDYLIQAHPECIAQGVLHYVRIHDFE